MTTPTQEPFAAVVEMRVGDSPAVQQLQQKLPSDKNFAADADVKQYCQSELWGIVTRIKQRRKLLEDEWLSNQRLRTLTHDGGQKYKGRSNVYMPTYATAHSTLLSQLSRGLFPSDEYMDVTCDEDDPMANTYSSIVKKRIQYEFDCNAQIKTQFKPMLSQLIDHGNGVTKYWFRTGQEFRGGKKKGQFAFAPKKQMGFTVSARSIFNVCVYPETASDEKEVAITAEYVTMSRQYALAMAKQDRWENTDEALQTNQVTAEDQYSRDQTLIDTAKIQGITERVDLGNITSPTVDQVTAVEVWATINLPKEAYVEGEDSSLPVPARILMFYGVPVCVTRNPYYHQQHPYKWSRVNVTPGSFYGSWAGRKSRGLQYLVNDFANQTNDAGILSLNPFMIVDTNMMTGPILPMAPGRIYRTRNIKEAMRFEHPPGELIQYGSTLIGMYTNALMDNSGAPPVLQGVGGKDSTATGQSILQRNSLQPLQDVIEDVEAQCLGPMMEDCWALLVQYSDQPVKMPDGTTVSISDLDSLSYKFKFLASSQVANQQARAQQAIQMLQNLAPNVQLLQMNGLGVNPAPILKQLHTDLGLRQYDQFIFPLPQQPMQPGMPGQPGLGTPQGIQTPGQALGAGAPQSQMPAPQLPRGPENNAPIPGANGAPPAPGTMDQFNVNRTLVDEMNAMAGGRAGG